jgi:hypothetical protein
MILFTSNSPTKGDTLPKITAFKARDRRLYRWPESDFDKYGKVPDVDQAVSTFISINPQHLTKSKLNHQATV